MCARESDKYYFCPHNNLHFDALDRNFSLSSSLLLSISPLECSFVCSFPLPFTFFARVASIGANASASLSFHFPSYLSLFSLCILYYCQVLRVSTFEHLSNLFYICLLFHPLVFHSRLYKNKWTDATAFIHLLNGLLDTLWTYFGTRNLRLLVSVCVLLDY